MGEAGVRKSGGSLDKALADLLKYERDGTKRLGADPHFKSGGVKATRMYVLLGKLDVNDRALMNLSLHIYPCLVKYKRCEASDGA
jgi:hypothetical protein